uniref:U3 small nucleolar RNA-associated protein 22 n=1 Tax=Coccidioides posadasii RMSCC 3488 TaxID=454284 RepID=A0A0J6F504_COCPO|nr:hypothetical protein CPAG_00717 [Coccidioides posadasii RMSCC 3488]
MPIPSAKRRKLVDGDEKSDGRKPARPQKDAPSPNGLNGIHGPRSQPVASAVKLATTSGQFKSNLFKLQIDELLHQLRPDDDKQLRFVQQPLRRLKEIIEGVPARCAKSVRDAEVDLRKAGVAIPFPEPRPSHDAKYLLEYARPTAISVVGSFALKTAVKGLGHPTVDLAVTIPKRLLQKKDYYNYRYIYKRAYYISCIAAGIKISNEPGFHLSYAYQDDDKLRPIILIELTERANDNNSRSKLIVRVITAVENDTFPVDHTTATRHKPGFPEFVSVYNSTVRAESSVAEYSRVLHAAIIKCPAFRDACILGRTWLRQRGFGTSIVQGGFGHFEWAILLALLLENGSTTEKALFSKSYNPYQLFKAMVQFLSGRDLTKPFVFFSDEMKQKLPVGSGPVLFDGKRGVNLLFKMTFWSYQLLRHEAVITLSMLNDPLLDHFDNIFINRVDYPLCRFDEYLTLRPQSSQKTALDILSCCCSAHGVLTKALGDRTRLVHISYSDSPRWPIQSDIGGLDIKPVGVGLLLNQDTCHRIVDRGPLAEDKEASSDFREFWGDKAELRRFKDGTIAETLVWSERPSDGSVIRQIITYSLCRHLDLLPDDIHFKGLDSEKFPAIRDVMRPRTDFQPVLDAFRSLECKLRNLHGLPLTFRQMFGASPILRHSSLDMSTSDRGWSKPIDVILQFEGSARWPDDLAAIQMTKLSFLIKIGELLEQSEGGVPCRVGLEDSDSGIQNAAFLDISFSHMLTFRLRLYHECEQKLLEKCLRGRNMGDQVKENLASALIAHKRLFPYQIQHTQAIQTLATRFPLLTPTIRAFKLWVNSHLFEPYFCEELLELLVCRVFLHPEPWTTPSSVGNGLLHTLYLISKWDWQHEPLVVDFNNKLTLSDFADIKTRFAAWRKIDPLMNTVSLFVASSLDYEGIAWTRRGKPPKVVALRLSNLTRAALDLVKKMGVEVCFSHLFRSLLQDYDFVLHLNPPCGTTSGGQQLYKNLPEPRSSGKVDVITHLLGELDRMYGSHILFFHGNEECKVIAGLWKPYSTKPRGFGLKLNYSIAPVTDTDATDQAVVLAKDTTLKDITTLGGDLISKAEINR